MIRLIASDLDGTLLKTDKTLPDGFGALLEELTKRGVTFVAASGRQYANILAALAPYADGCYIISDNGAVNGFGGNITETFALPRSSTAAVLKGLDGSPAVPLICTADCGYYADPDPVFVRELGRYYARTEYVGAEGMRPIDALVKCAEENGNAGAASKIAVFCNGHADELISSMPAAEGLTSVVSGADWIDFVRTDVTKGSALASLLRRLGISPNECLAFGDQFNDREMLELCGESYVTAGASAGMRALFPAVASNDESGVINKIREVLGL